MKSFKALNRQMVQEGRPSQRHPLEGHEYHKKSDEALIHIARDAHKAAEAMKSHNTDAENKYRDQANDSATVRYFRKKNGMPEWYKKKYGHVKEGVVEEGENNQVKDGDPCWTGYQMVGMKNKGGKKVPNCVPTKEEVEPIEEAAKGTLHRVRYSHDDSSGNGIASGNLSLHAPDKESASRYAESDLKKRGKKNIKIHAVTPQKSSIKEAKAPAVKKEVELTAYQKLLKQIKQNAKNDPHRIPRGYERTAHGELVKKHKTEKSNDGVGGWGESVELDEAEEKIKYVSGHGWGPGRVQVTTNKGRKMMVKHEITKDHSYTGPKVGHKMSDWEHMKEEVEPIEELSKNTLKSYIPAAARDLSKKGINAGIDAKSGKPGVTKEYGDHFEKRYKGIIKATRKLAKEQAEPIEELSRETLLQYNIRAIPWSVTHRSIASAARKDAAAITDPNDHYGANDLRMKARGHSMIAKKRDAGIKKANDRLKKDSEKNYYKDHWKANRGYYGPEQPLQKEEVSKTSDATTSAEIGTPAQLSLKVAPKKLETPVYESRQMQIVREALADAKKKDAAKKKEKKVNPGGDDKFNSEPELTSSITKNT